MPAVWLDGGMIVCEKCNRLHMVIGVIGAKKRSW